MSVEQKSDEKTEATDEETKNSNYVSAQQKLGKALSDVPGFVKRKRKKIPSHATTTQEADEVL